MFWPSPSHKLTVMPVHVEGISAPNGQIVEQAEAMAAQWVIVTGDNACGARMVSWRPDSAERVPSLHSLTQ